MTKQIMGVILGFGAMVVVSLIDYKWIMNFYWILYVINLILLIAVKIPGLGHSANGAQRWINLGFMQLQPSDLTKILLIIFFARFFSDRELKISSPKVIIQSVALLIPSLILIVTQPNLSTTICIAALFCALIFLAGLITNLSEQFLRLRFLPLRSFLPLRCSRISLFCMTTSRIVFLPG